MDSIEQQKTPTEPRLADIAWDTMPAIETRRILAKNFEQLVVANMNKGQISSDDAQKVAAKFVELLKQATTYADIFGAIRSLQVSGDRTLVQFGLKAEEAYRIFLSRSVYHEAIELAHRQQYAAILKLSNAFYTGEIQSTRDVMAKVLKYELVSEVNSLIEKLNQAGLKTQAESLGNALANNQIADKAALNSWKSLLETNKTFTANTQTATNKVATLEMPPSLLRKANTMLHNFDQWLRRHVISKSKQPPTNN